MQNFEFLKKYQRLQESIMYDELIDLGFAVIGYSKTDKSTFWNLALTDSILSELEISEIENRFNQLPRNPTIYFENKEDMKPLVNLLLGKNYQRSYEDSWQFWKGGNIDDKHFDSVKKVTNPEELKAFLEIFDNCYRKDDPQNPYGELGEYLKAAEEAWQRHNKTDRLEYFIVYKEDKLVAVSALTNFDGIGYISNVGSLGEVRGEGFGKAATLYCVNQSIKNGNTEHCLATEEGAYPNEFYKRIGFETKFTAVAYTKKEVKASK